MTGEMRMTDLEIDHDGTIFDDHGQTVPAAVAVLHNNMIKALHRAYPKWKQTWHIRIDTRGGIVQVYNKVFSGDMGFAMHIEKIDPEMRKVVKYAGELFERFNIARDRGKAIAAAMADAKKDRIGRFKHED